MPQEQQPLTIKEAQERFRSSLGDSVILLKKMIPLCQSIDEMVELFELAMVNDSQLSLIMERVSPLMLKK